MPNPNIALGVQPMQLQLPDPNSGMNALMRAMQIKSAMQEQDFNSMRADEMRRGIADTNALNEAYSGALGPDGVVDRNALYRTLAGRNLGSKIPGLQEQFLKTDKATADLGKTKAETQKAELEMALKKTEHMSSMLSLANPQNWPTVRNVVKAQLGQDLPEQFDPQWIAASVAGGQTLTQRLAAEHQRLTLEETGRHNRTTETETGRHNLRTEGLQGAQIGETRRHNQQMEGFRAGEVGQGKTQIVETPQGFVIVDKGTGQSRPAVGADGQPLKGKANDRVMTDAQAKANLFGTRMKEADRILSGLEGQYWPGAVNAKMAAGEVPVVGGITGYAGNLMLSEKGQQAEQAQRDFLNATLRRESGALISPQEFANGQKQYFPQPGDTPAVLQQKARNRKLAISGMEAEVPGGFRAGPSLTNPGGNQGGATGDFSPDIDALVKKYGGG